MSENPELRVWTVLLSTASQFAIRGISYEVWAHDAAEATRLALEDMDRRGEIARDAGRCEIGPRLARQSEAPQVRFRASQVTRLRAHTGAETRS